MVAVVAVTDLSDPGARVVGLASAHRVTDQAAEIAILVEDEFQGRGIGRRLLDRLVVGLWARGDTEVRADVLGGQGAPIHLLRARFGRLVTEIEMGVLHVQASLPRIVRDDREGHPVRDVA